MKIVILTAMEDELLPIIKDVPKIDYQTEFYNNIYLNNEGENTLYFSYTGIGKVNAAMSTTILINIIKPDLVINLGTAGGINKNLKILDLVIADKLAYHDVDVTAFGYKLGQIPQNEIYLKTNINKEFIQKLKDIEENIYVGTIVTGDQFVNKQEDKVKIENNFQNVYAVEMESTVIVDVCNKLKTKVIVIRGISDLTHTDSTIEFDIYLEQVVKKFSKIIKVIQNYDFF